MKLKCKCGKIATWLYMPGSDLQDDAKCDDCVPRGCTCNTFPTIYEDAEDKYEISPKGIEGKDWEWVEKDEYFRDLDGEGRELPCCEWWYNEEGWDEDE